MKKNTHITMYIVQTQLDFDKKIAYSVVTCYKYKYV